MNENTSTNNQTAPKTFDIIDGNTLMAQEYEPLQFAVEKILPHGLFILAGSGKIGKSWLSLDLCVNVATGGKLWDFSSEQGDVLYLALEDNYPRLQDRLNKIKAAAVDISRLKLTTASFGINSGLIEQAHNHLAAFPDTKLIVIDTLERIRDTEFDKNIYACDYRDMTLLREITNKHKLTLLFIHHMRKMSDSDPLNFYSLLQDHFHDHMKEVDFTGFERGERGSTAEHLSVLEFKAKMEREAALALEVEQKRQTAAALDKAIEGK